MPETVTAPPHNHMPTPAVLRLVGDAMARAGVRAHFDVGPPAAYKALGPAYSLPMADDYIIQNGARGGSRSSRCRAIRRMRHGASFPIFQER